MMKKSKPFGRMQIIFLINEWRFSLKRERTRLTYKLGTTSKSLAWVTDATHFYIKHGLSNQRLKALTLYKEMPTVIKWQKMMEIFLTTQIHVIAGLGYSADEQGLSKYAQDLSQCMQQADDDIRDVFTDMRRDTWRDLVSFAFALTPEQMKDLSIVEARNVMHKVASKMIEPDVLAEIKSRCDQLPETDDPQLELAEKHRVVRANDNPRVVLCASTLE